MRRKEMEELLAERSERITLLEARIDNLQTQLDGYRQREQSIIDSLTNANDTAKRSIGEAQAQAREILSAAESDAARLLEDAHAQAQQSAAQAEASANAIVSGAQAQADQWTSEAAAQADAMVSDAEARLKEKREELARYQADLARCASAAQAMVEQFAAYVQSNAADPAFSEEPGSPSDLVQETPDLSLPKEDEPVFRTYAEPVDPDDLPDAENPAQVMQNIYKLQNRDLTGTAVEEETPPEPDHQDDSAFEEDYAPRPEPDFDPSGEPEAEWQPEQEPEVTDVPTVSDLLSDVQEDTDVSLDALLDEIIKAGE